MLTRSTIADVVHAAVASFTVDSADASTGRVQRDSDTFAEIGLNSLMLARLVVTLEDELEVDPFGEDVSIVDIHTLGELIDTYDNALSGLATARTTS